MAGELLGWCNLTYLHAQFQEGLVPGKHTKGGNLTHNPRLIIKTILQLIITSIKGVTLWFPTQKTVNSSVLVGFLDFSGL